MSYYIISYNLIVIKLNDDDNDIFWQWQWMQCECAVKWLINNTIYIKIILY